MEPKRSVAGDGPSRFRILVYAEYVCELKVDVFSPRGPPRCIEGTLLRENGLDSERRKTAVRPRWLRAITLPINRFVERELCAEFQLLEALCEIISSALPGGLAGCASGREAATGEVRVLISSSSCLSCVAAFRQFQLLWPRMLLAVGFLPKLVSQELL